MGVDVEPVSFSTDGGGHAHSASDVHRSCGGDTQRKPNTGSADADDRSTHCHAGARCTYTHSCAADCDSRAGHGYRYTAHGHARADSHATPATGQAAAHELA
jgi:hypothetical protein